MPQLLSFNKSKTILIVSVVYLIIFFALSSGLINAILEGSNLPEGITFIPSRSIQTISETIIMTLTLLVGMSGAFLLYKSGFAITSKTQYGFLAGGFFIVAISLILGLMLINNKI
jgi:hypothetical protein